MCRFFHPCVPTEQEIREYIDLSERGIGKERGKFSKNPLVIGKSRRGLTMEMWEEGVLEGTVPYMTLLGGFAANKKWWQFWRGEHQQIPRYVVDSHEEGNV